MASLTSSGLTLESGTTTLRSILGAENVLVTSNIIPSWNQGTLKRDYDITLGNLNPGQAAYCTVTNSSDVSRIQIYLPSGGKFIYEIDSSPKPTITPNSRIHSGGSVIQMLAPGASLCLTYCRAY